ncbi:MAG: hypothetical protein AAGA75_12880 [Cyanobacteria bacterium P01_E01_bin.6]
MLIHPFATPKPVISEAIASCHSPDTFWLHLPSSFPSLHFSSPSIS